jgi:hypothetical protein
MASSGLLRHVALVRTDVSEELSASIIRVTRIGELGTTLSSSETSVLTRAAWRINPEDAILHLCAHLQKTYEHLTVSSGMKKQKSWLPRNTS